MNEELNNLMAQCSVVEPLDGRILVYPLPLRTYEKEETVVDYKKASKLKKNPTIDEMPMKKIVNTINYGYQRAVVIKVSANEPRLKEGELS